MNVLLNRKIIVVINSILILCLISSSGLPANVRKSTLAPPGWRQRIALRDKDFSELLWLLFNWLRGRKSNVELITFKRWFTDKGLSPIQMKDKLVVHSSNHTMIIYPAEKNEFGTKLHRSKYRLYVIPRRDDIRNDSDIESIFEEVDRVGSIAEEKELKRLREVVHDLVDRYSMIFQAIQLLKTGEELDNELDVALQRIGKIVRDYQEDSNILGKRAAIKILRTEIGTLRQAILVIRDGAKRGLEEGELKSVVLTGISNFIRLLEELEDKGDSKEIDSVDIVRVLKEGLKLENPYAELEIDIPAEIGEVFVPSREIEVLRVFWNMLSNSASAVKESIFTGKGKIKISASLVKEKLVVVLEDNGKGIPKELLRIPEGQDRPWIFASGHTTKTDEPGEHGLGLGYVWDTVVGKWSGKINVESAEGNGSKFILEVPVEKDEDDLPPMDPQGEKDMFELAEALEVILTRYSNVHRGMGQHSQVSTHLYEKAREIVAEHLGVDLDEYTVIFGSNLDRMIKNLTPDADYKIVDTALGALFGIAAIAVRKEDFKEGVPYETGGGMVSWVMPDDVYLADAPERYEAGTPNIPGAIALAKLLKMRLKTLSKKAPIDSSKLVEEIFYREDPKERSLSLLGDDLIGKGAKVPTREEEVPYINFDNGASTPTFKLVFNVFKKALGLPQERAKSLIGETRTICADFLQAPQDEYDVIFTRNTTEGINIVSHHYEFPPHSVVLNSVLEHNSNELPWRYIPGVSQERLGVDENGFFDLSEMEDILRSYNEEHEHGEKRIRLVAVSGASNVLGSVNDIQKMAEIAHKYGAKILIDAAQLVAHRPIKMNDWDIDFLVFSGHKAYAPFGASALIAKRGLMPNDIKDIDNTAGITALGRALLMLKRLGMEKVAEHEKELTRYILEKLNKIEGIEILGASEPEYLDRRLGVISFDIPNISHALIAAVLAEEGGVGVRSGCFCAHLLLQDVVGIEHKGEVRVSLGLYNTKEEIDRMLEILHNLISGKYDLGKYRYDETGDCYTQEFKRRLDEFLEQVEDQVFGEKHILTEAEISQGFVDLADIHDGNRRLFGNKASKYGVFNRLNLNYPKGFVVNSKIVKNTRNLDFFEEHFWPNLESQINALEAKTGKRFGDKENPLILATRSSPEFSMPAILTSVLNIGINDEIAASLAETHGEFFAYDTYRRFIENYGVSVLGLPMEDFKDIFIRAIHRLDKGMKGIVEEYKEYISNKGKEIPPDVWAQLRESIKVVIKSWDTPRAKNFRLAEGISDESGFGVIVQNMVFGSLNNNSASGILFTRNPNTGQNELYGDYSNRAQGQDIVSGRFRGHSLRDMRMDFPDIYNELVQIKEAFERVNSWPQEIEFTIEDGKLYFLQTRDIEFAVPVRETVLKQLEEEGITSRYQAVERLLSWQKRQQKRKVYRVKKGVVGQTLFRGISSTPGAIKGKLALSIEKALEYSEEGHGVILLVTPESKGIFRNIFSIPQIGLITTYGNASFHEAVLCRLSGIPSIISEIGKKIKEGDIIILDGDNNRIFTTEEEDVLEEVEILADITFGIDLTEYQNKFNRNYYKPNSAELKEEYSYSRLMELNISYRDKFLELQNQLEPDSKNDTLRREVFTANLEKHFIHELLYQLGEALGKTREEIDTELSQIIHLVDLGKIMHEIGDLILFERKVFGEGGKAKALAEAREIVVQNPGAELIVEETKDLTGAELIKVVKSGEAEILYKEEYLWHPYEDDRNEKLEEDRAKAQVVVRAFPGAQLLERTIVTYIHDGGAQEIMYYFVVYRQRKELSDQLWSIVHYLLGMITTKELDEGDEKLVRIKNVLADEYRKATGVKRILLWLLMAELGIESDDLIVISDKAITQEMRPRIENNPNVLIWQEGQDMRFLLSLMAKARKPERTIFILDSKTMENNFKDYQFWKEYKLKELGRAMFIPILPKMELLQLLHLAHEILAADFSKDALSLELRKLLQGKDISSVRDMQPQHLLGDVDQARDELMELIESA